MRLLLRDRLSRSKGVIYRVGPNLMRARCRSRIKLVGPGLILAPRASRASLVTLEILAEIVEEFLNRLPQLASGDTFVWSLVFPDRACVHDKLGRAGQS